MRKSSVMRRASPLYPFGFSRASCLSSVLWWVKYSAQIDEKKYFANLKYFSSGCIHWNPKQKPDNVCFLQVSTFHFSYLMFHLKNCHPPNITSHHSFSLFYYVNLFEESVVYGSGFTWIYSRINLLTKVDLMLTLWIEEKTGVLFSCWFKVCDIWHVSGPKVFSRLFDLLPFLWQYGTTFHSHLIALVYNSSWNYQYHASLLLKIWELW